VFEKGVLRRLGYERDEGIQIREDYVRSLSFTFFTKH
jgi:hypothetical protein